MATLIGVVRLVVGEVFAVAADGSKRQLGEGDKVFAGEQLLTGAGGAVAIRLVNGGELTMGRDSSLQLDNELLAGDAARARIQPASPEQAPGAEDLAEVEQVQQAIAAGADPTLSLPPTAAGAAAGGAGDGGGGVSFVMLDETAQRVDPTIGYPTGPLQFEPLSPEVFPSGVDEAPDPAPSVVIEYFSDAAGQVLVQRGFVDEAALPGGSRAGSDGEISYGRLSITSPDGIAAVEIQDKNGNWVDVTGGGIVQGQYGTLVVAPGGTWVFTLDSSAQHASPTLTGASDQSLQGFPVRVIDNDGDVSPPVTLQIDIADDGPTAFADGNDVTEGGVVTGNVLTDGTDDAFGADGPTAGGGVVGVRLAGGDTVTAVTTGVGATISGLYGKLILQADGTYSYDGNPDAVPQGGASEVFVYTIRDGDGDLSTTTLTIELSDSGLATSSEDLSVDEAALAGGSNPPSNAETITGTVADNVQGGSGPYTYTLQGSGTGSHGTLTFNADGSYTYTLTQPYDSTPDTDDGAHTENDAEVFSFLVTDGNGNSQTGTITIDIVDDVPTARADLKAGVEGEMVTGNVLGDGAADVFGADGPAAGGGVVGVRLAGGDTTSPVTTGVGATISGLYGTLILQADGSYSYDGDADVVPQGGATEVFVYTIRDGDGDLSTTTLTIELSDSKPSAPDDQEVLVYENALDLSRDGADLAAGSVTGSLPGSTGETDTGNQLDATGVVPLSYALVGNANGNYGTIQVNADGSYTYTLTKPYDSRPEVNDGANVERGVDSFIYRVTDANGNTMTGTIRIDIVDDVPSAYANIRGGIEGAEVIGNVLTDGTDDVFGADGPATGGGVVGVRLAGSDTSTAVTTGVGATISGLYGTLTLQADGSYIYDGNPNVVPPGGASDVFVYTIKDGDGDLATTTLTISLSDSGLSAPDDQDVRVNERALDLSQDGADLAPGSVTGSLPGNTGETDANNQLNATGVGPLTYALVGNAAGAYGTIQINADGSYIYTLTKPYTSSPEANDGAHVESGVDTFTYQVTDGNGNTMTGTIRIDIVDDVPSAYANIRGGIEGAEVIGNVLTDGMDDVFGADGPATGGGVVGVRLAGSDTSSAVTEGVGTIIAGVYGSLTLQADGSYIYTSTPDAVTGDQASDVFVYTIKDGDGDLATTTLTISLSGSGLSAPDDQDVQVNERALDLTQDGADLAPGTVTGSLPGSTGETDASNQLNASGVIPLSYVLVGSTDGSAEGAYGTIKVNADGSYTYTLTKPYTSAGDVNDGANVESGVDTFTYQVTDGNGNTLTGTIRIDIVDDVPTARADLNSVVEGGVVEGNVLTDGTADVFGADGPAAGGGVVGVRLAGGDTSTAVTTGVGTAIAGVYGTLTLQADGSYSYDGDPNTVPQGGASEVFVYTIRDGDGDLSTTTLTINLSDSGLTAPDDQDARVYESALDPQQDGTDLAAGSVTGSLPLGRGETDADNQLNASGLGTLSYALVGDAVGDYGVIRINGDGSYTYTLTKPYTSSPEANDGANVESGVDTFTYQVTDGNGNTLTGTIRIDIVDDVPRAFLPEHGMLVDQVATSRSIEGDLRFAEAAGADGVGDVFFTPSIGKEEGDLAMDASGNLITLLNPDTGKEEQLYLHYSADGSTLEARTEGGLTGFTIVLDPATDSYTLTTHGVLSNDTSIVISNLSATGSAGHDNFKGLIDVGGTAQDVLMSSTTGAVNSTQTDVGIGDQWIQGPTKQNPADNIRFDFLSDLAVDETSPTGFSYSTHNLVYSFRQGIAQVQGNSSSLVNLTLLAIIADNDDVFGVAEPGESYVNLSTTDITVYNAQGEVVSGLTMTDNSDGSITIHGLQDDWSYEINSATQFSAVQVSGATGSAPFTLAGFSYSQVLPEQPIELSYQISGTDGDGDSITSAVQATLYPQSDTLEGPGGGAGDDNLTGTAADDWIFGHDGNDNLSGLIGDDALSGGEGDDILAGGQGSDLLSGGAGEDTFVWSSGDIGVDRITDFTLGEDHLDLSDLLDGVDGSLGSEDLASSLTSYLSMTFGASTTITVNPDAAGPLPANQSIVLEGVDLSLAYETTDQATIIQNMLDDGSLKVV